jgi:hypothetical protein
LIILLWRVSWNEFSPRFSMLNNQANPSTSEGYFLHTFIGN